MKKELEVGAISINGFKAFDNTAQVIPIAPITVIFGENSSGKSSIIQAIRIIIDLIKNNDLIETSIDFSSWGIDLSDFMNNLFRSSVDLNKVKKHFSRKFNVGFWVKLNLQHTLSRPPGYESEEAWIEKLNELLEIQNQVADTPWLGPNGAWLEFDITDVSDPSDEALIGNPLPDQDKIVKPYISKIAFTTSIFENGSHTIEWIYNNETNLYFRNSENDKHYFDKATNSLYTVDEIDINENAYAIIDNSCLHFIKRPGIINFDFLPNPSLTTVVPNPYLDGYSDHSKQFLAWLNLRLNHALNAIIKCFDSIIHLGPNRRIPELADYSNKFSQSGNETLSKMSDSERKAWKLLRDPEPSKLLDNINDWLGYAHFSTHYKINRRFLINSKILLDITKDVLKVDKFTTSDDHLVGPAVEKLFKFLSELPDNRLFDIDIGILILKTACEGLGINTISSRFIHLIEALLKQAEIDLHENSSNRLYDCIRKINVDFSEVGQGMHNFFPIILNCLGSNEACQIIEQPELHLHPRLQAEMGDLFINSLQQGNTFIIETHSEHLLLRILKRIRETSDHPSRTAYKLNISELSIIHVSSKEQEVLPSYWQSIQNPAVKNSTFCIPDSHLGMLSHSYHRLGSAMVQVIPVTPQGDLEIDWPGGFFPERMKEIYSDQELNKWYNSNPNSEI